jgi:hypothetical protein
MADKWLNYTVIILKGNRNPVREKEFIIKVIKPFVESDEDSIDLFHFTRIFKGKEDIIRWRIKPSEGQFDKIKNKLVNLLKELQSKSEVLEFREESFDIDPTHNKLGGKSENYDLFMKFLDSISRITIGLFARNADNGMIGYIPSPDYYAHFLFNQFGSHSFYGVCPKCGKGSWTFHACAYCGTAPIPGQFKLSPPK